MRVCRRIKRKDKLLINNNFEPKVIENLCALKRNRTQVSLCCTGDKICTLIILELR